MIIELRVENLVWLKEGGRLCLGGWGVKEKERGWDEIVFEVEGRKVCLVKSGVM